MSANASHITKILQAQLVGGCIESYGLLHQNLFIQIRNGDDFDLIINSSVRVISDNFKNRYQEIEKDKKLESILIFDFLNLKKIKNVFCSTSAILNIEFITGEILLIGETQESSTFFGEEPWEISISNQEEKIIAEKTTPAEYMIFGEW